MVRVVSWRVIAQRSDVTYLVTEGSDDRAHVLDLAQRTLFPPCNTQSVLARGYWEEPSGELPDVEQLLRTGAIEVITL